MLLKYSQAEKRTKTNINGKQQRATGGMKLTVGLPTPRVNRKVMRGLATKRTALGQQRVVSTRAEERTTVDPCDNSNDSGLGFDHHLEYQLAARSTVRFADQEASWANEHSEVKRKKLEIKLESDDANDNFSFPERMNRREETERLPSRTNNVLEQVENTPTTMVGRTQTRPQAITSRRSAAVSLASQLMGMSRDAKCQLQILCQPEQQHRARYQTEGSRGAVKDRSGNGFPVVKLVGYNKPATLQVFIGTDVGRVAPHMFYQACRVSGKNSTPCVERKIDGTIVIEVDFDPSKDMVVTCDCVGILKERNVDVEHRFPDQSGSRNKKKSTRCRMVFRTTITHPDGSTEILQTTSQPIVCTQPPGVPEICKKSLSACPCTGGMELFILGKNFLKDTRVVFQHGEQPSETWEEAVQPDKEYLQQTHLVCVVPPYQRVDLTEAVTVRLVVVSSGKTSEPHTFTYTPTLQQPAVASEGTQPCVQLVQSGVSHSGAEVPHVFPRSTLVLSDTVPNTISTGSSQSSPKKSSYPPTEPTAIVDAVHPVMMWQSANLLPNADTSKLEKTLEPKELGVLSGKMMPPPLLPITTRRASTNLRLIVPDPDTTSLLPEKLKTEMLVPFTEEKLKTELEDSNSRSPEDVKGIDLRMKPVATVNPMATVEDLSSTQSPTMATFRRFVTGSTGTPLPTQTAHSVETYLSCLENVDTTVVTKATSNGLISTCKLVDTVPSASTQIDIRRNTGNTSQFQSGPTLFGNQTTTDPKIQFTNDLPMPLIYGTQAGTTISGRDDKSQFVTEERTSLEPSSSLTVNGSAESILGGRRPLVILQESQTAESNISRHSTCSTLTDSLNQNVSLLTDAPSLLQTSSGLYGTSDKTTRSSMLSVSSQPEDRVVLDSLSKANDSVVVSAVGNSVQDSSLIPTSSLDATSSMLGNQMLAVTQSSIITNAQNSRLNDLVNSAINTHGLVSSSSVQSSETEKLDALVNSAAVSHMISSSSCPPISVTHNVLNSAVEVPLSQENVPSTVCQTSVPVKKMSIDTPVEAVTTLGGFDLLPSQHPSTQLSQENARMLNNAVSTAFTEHLLVTPQTQVQTGSLSNAQLTVDTSVTSNPVNTIYRNREQTSPIAMKNIILNSAATVDGEILVASPTHTSPVAVKSMILDTSNVLSHNQIMTTGSTSPIAVKNMVAAVPTAQTSDNHMLSTSPTGVSHVPMKNILNSTITPQENQIIVTSPNHTSPIAMKTMILESAAVEPCLTNSTHTSPIAVKTMLLNSQLSDNNIGANMISGATVQSAQISADNARLDALVQSTLSNHSLVPDTTQRTSAVGVHANNGITILPPQVHLQQASQVPSTSPLVPQTPSCITTMVTQPLNSSPHIQPLNSSSHMSVPVVTTSEVLLNTILAVSRNSTDDSSIHNFDKKASVIVGTDSQPNGQRSPLLHTSQFTTASSSPQSLLTGITMPSKMAEELAAQSRDTSSGFVTQMLLDLAADDKMKKNSQLALMSRDKITEQPPSNFISVAENKLPETRLFTTGATNSHIQPTVLTQSQVTTMNNLAMTKLQQAQEDQCKSQQQHSIVPHTTTCVTGTTLVPPGQPQKKGEEGMVPQELTQMSDNDLLSYINPNAFDQV